MQTPNSPSNDQEKPANLGFSLLHIERYLQGELTLAEQAEIRKAADTHPQLAAYLQRTKTWTEAAQSLKLPELPNNREPSSRNWLAAIKNRLQDVWLAWERPAWGMPGLAMAAMVLLVGVISLTLTRPTQQAESRRGHANLRPKGGLGADMSIGLRGKSHTSGADLAVTPGDTLRIFYHSSDSLYFQLWSRDGRNDFHLMHAGEGLPASARWCHSGKSLVIDDQNNMRQLILIWAASNTELDALEKKYSKEKKWPEENSSIFNIHFPQAK